MSTDRELLELAAKAAGISGEYREDMTDDRGVFRGIWGSDYRGGPGYFNPSQESADAFWLMIELCLSVDICGASVEVSWMTLYGTEKVTEKFNGDLHYSTSYAIVRAAAEIGRAMP